MARNIHVAVLPWSAFGHLMPFFQLSIALAKTGIKVSFLSTPRNIQRVPKPPSTLENLINFVELPMPNLDADLLPQGAEATVEIPFEKIQYLKIAYDLLKHPFKQFVADQNPDWILVDVIPYWAAEIAQEFQVPVINFSVYSASAFVFLVHPEYLIGEGQKRMRPSPESMTSPPEWVNFPSKLAYRSFEARDVFCGFYGENASGIADAERVYRVIKSCQAVAFRSCPEVEGEYLKLLEKTIGKPVIPVGLLPPEKPEEKEINNGSSSETMMFEWLDEQKPKSVVFVGFGSECKLNKDQTYEIAHGLELSGLPFLWALRKPSWASDELEALPPGFREKTSKKGLVCMGWVPQFEILSHQSIGASLFHSGWGSAIETLVFGHCPILLPFIVDQPLNARFLVEKGLAVEVVRSEDGSFSRDGVAEALKLAMVSEEGGKLRARAKEASAIFGDRKLHQDYYFARFVEYLKAGFAK